MWKNRIEQLKLQAISDLIETKKSIKQKELVKISSEPILCIDYSDGDIVFTTIHLNYYPIDKYGDTSYSLAFDQARQYSWDENNNKWKFIRKDNY